MKHLKPILFPVLFYLGSIFTAQSQYILGLPYAPCTGSVPLQIRDGSGAEVTSNIWNISWKINNTVVSGATGYELVLSISGTYSATFCIGSSSGNCTTYTASLPVTVAGGIYSSVLINGPQAICNGQSLTYTATGTGMIGSFSDGLWGGDWYVNGVYTGTSTQTYTSSSITPGALIEFHGGFACGSLNASLQTTSQPAPMLYAAGNPSQFCASDNSQVLNASSGSGFQWKFDGATITGANTMSYHPTQSGNYSVSLTNTCTSTTAELGPINVAMQANCLPMAVWSVTGSNSATANNDLTVNGNTRLNGKLLTKGMKITLSPGTDAFPDYVFGKDYPLMPLEALEAYIEKHSHLPEVPSAKEVEAEGMDIKEMNLLLLKKLEENTLYLLQMKQQIEAQQKEIDRLKKK